MRPRSTHVTGQSGQRPLRQIELLSETALTRIPFDRKLLLLRGGRFRRFLRVALVKAIHAASCINQLLFPCEKRMAGRTNFDVQITFSGRTGLEGLAAGAGYCDFRILRMNSWFHGSSYLYLLEQDCLLVSKR